MSNRKSPEWSIPESSATPESVYRSRRRFLAGLSLGAIGGAALVPAARHVLRPAIGPTSTIYGAVDNEEFGPPGRDTTSSGIVYRFNNFYEFSLIKSVPITACRKFSLDPWSLVIDGMVKKPLKIGLEDILKMQLEQRVYRFRCVEAWAMTVPWIGVPLSTLLNRAEPLPAARHVSIQSFLDPVQAPRQQRSNMPWPYRETLSIAEAMHPLTLAAIGMYGTHLQPQCGAPMRVVIPWKYGFKGPKSVVRMTLTPQPTATFWNSLQPDEYGLVANVEPDVPHPRWSQDSEVLLGTGGERVPTIKFNGYGPWVAELYRRNA